MKVLACLYHCTSKERLRGCIGYIKSYKTLYKSLIELAQMAAFEDDRFTPVSKDEFVKDRGFDFEPAI